MLWDENIASVAYGYSDSISKGLPGPVDESGYTHFHEDLTAGYRWDPAKFSSLGTATSTRAASIPAGGAAAPRHS